MIDMTILAMSQDEDGLARLVGGPIDRQGPGRDDGVDGRGMRPAGLLRARLIALDCSSGAMSSDELDRLLWVNSTLAHPAMVLVVDDEYQADLALTLFQMGVDEYLSIPDHAARLSTVMRHLLETTPTGDSGVQELIPARLSGASRSCRRFALAAAASIACMRPPVALRAATRPGADAGR